MDSAERGGRWRNLKGRLGFKGMGCCGAAWGSRSSNMNVREEEEDDDDDDETMYVGQIPAGSGMNLATALAAERHLRAAGGGGGGGGGVGSTTAEIAPDTPLRVSLMRLLEEADGGDGGREKERGEGSDGVCCVCMGRKKGAAFIPCGHTFCRVCTREVWLNRGSCPLCNRPILEILDIF